MLGRIFGTDLYDHLTRMFHATGSNRTNTTKNSCTSRFGSAIQSGCIIILKLTAVKASYDEKLI